MVTVTRVTGVVVTVTGMGIVTGMTGMHIASLCVVVVVRGTMAGRLIALRWVLVSVLVVRHPKPFPLYTHRGYMNKGTPAACRGRGTGYGTMTVDRSLRPVNHSPMRSRSA